MKEVSLDELEKWYMKSLKGRFKREHKVLSKFYALSEKEVAQAKHAVKSWQKIDLKKRDLPAEEMLDEKGEKIMERFLNTIMDAINEVKIPTVHAEITYETSQKFCDDIKKLFMTYNSAGKKSIPRFMKQFTLEIKEVDLHLRKAGDLANKVGNFLRKNYSEGKLAEAVLKRIPRLNHDIERLGQIKGKISQMDDTFSNLETNLKNAEDGLYDLSQDPDLQAYEKIDTLIQQKSRRLGESLKFKKAFKKLKKALEKGTIYARGVREEDLKPYLKDPIRKMTEEGPKIPALREILIKVRLILEDEKDPLKLKADLRRRIIENINNIVSKNKLEDKIKGLMDIYKEREDVRKILESKGLESKRKEFKDKIMSLTLEVEHFGNDLNRRKREFRELLEKVGQDRDALQKEIENETGEAVKLKVSISS